MCCCAFLLTYVFEAFFWQLFFAGQNVIGHNALKVIRITFLSIASAFGTLKLLATRDDKKLQNEYATDCSSTLHKNHTNTSKALWLIVHITHTIGKM